MYLEFGQNNNVEYEIIFGDGGERSVAHAIGGLPVGNDNGSTEHAVLPFHVLHAGKP
jgi:hypothetical protein